MRGAERDSIIVQGSRVNQVVAYDRDGSLLWASNRHASCPGYGTHPALDSIVAGFSNVTICVFGRTRSGWLVELAWN